MKKLFIIATIGIAGCLSAKPNNATVSTKSFSQKVEFKSGWCEIAIYRVNGDGSQTLVKYSYTLESSEAACSAKYSSMYMSAALGQ